jgi:hypothetical protein
MLNSQTPRADTPVFVRVGDHGNAFERFHVDGRPWPLALDQKGGLFDSAPNSGALPAPNLDPAKAAAIGARKAQVDQGGGGAIPRELASQLHDMSIKAAMPEADHAAFTRVLSALCASEPSPGAMEKAAAADKGGGSGKISVDRANRAWKVAKDAGLNPSDLAQFVELLRPFVDPSLSDEDEESQPSGALAGDEKLRSFEADFPEVARIKIDTWGVPVPETKRDRQKLRMALDAASNGGAGGGYLGNDAELDAMVKRIGRC